MKRPPQEPRAWEVCHNGARAAGPFDTKPEAEAAHAAMGREGDPSLWVRPLYGPPSHGWQPGEVQNPTPDQQTASWRGNEG